MAKIIGAAIIAGGGSQYPKLKGTWVFNSVITQPNFGNNVDVNFTSNSQTLGRIHHDGGGYATLKYSGGAGVAGDPFVVYTYTDDDTPVNTWTNAAYRVITFTTPFKRDTNPEFYDWFVSNAVRKKGNVVVNITKSGNYKLWKVDGVKYNSAQTLSLNYGDTITITGSNPMYYGNAITLNGTTVNSTSAGKTQNPYNLLLIDDVYNMDLYGYYGHTSGTPTSTILYGTCKITSSNN